MDVLDDLLDELEDLIAEHSSEYEVADVQVIIEKLNSMVRRYYA